MSEAILGDRKTAPNIPPKDAQSSKGIKCYASTQKTMTGLYLSPVLIYRLWSGKTDEGFGESWWSDDFVCRSSLMDRRKELTLESVG